MKTEESDSDVEAPNLMCSTFEASFDSLGSADSNSRNDKTNLPSRNNETNFSFQTIKPNLNREKI